MNIFNKKVFSFSTPPFGIDIGDGIVRVVQFDLDGGEENLRSYGTVNLPANAVVDGEIVEKGTVVEAIKACLKQTKPKSIKGNMAICALPESKAFLRIISIPRMEEQELGETIKWELEANIPMAIDQVYYDWQLIDDYIGQDQKKMNILVVAVARSVVDQLIDVLSQAGLNMIALETESIAQSRSLIETGNKSETTLIIDIGAKHTSFLISVGDTPCFTSSVPVSIQMILGNFSKYFGIDTEESKKIMLTYGIGSVVSQDAVFRVVKPVMENLVSEIRRSIDFFVSDLKYSKSVDNVLLIGEGALLRGMIPYLSKELEVEVVTGNPWINVQTKNKLPAIDYNESVKYVTSVGLGLRGVRQNQ